MQSEDRTRLRPKKLARGAAVDWLLASLRKRIIEGSLSPGQRLVAGDIEDEYGLGRSTVRETLNRLASEGIVDLVRNRGALVRRFSDKEMLDIFQMRIAIEGLAARLAAENFGDNPESRELAESAGRFDVNSEFNSSKEFLPENARFHNAILGLSANAELKAYIYNTKTVVAMKQVSSLMDRVWIAQSSSEHCEIFWAIARQQPEEAEARMRSHLHRSFTEFSEQVAKNTSRLQADAL